MDQETFEAWGLRLLRGETISKAEYSAVFGSLTPRQRGFFNPFCEYAFGDLSMNRFLRRQRESDICHDVVCGQLDQLKEHKDKPERMEGSVKHWGDVNSSWNDTYAKMKEHCAEDLAVKSWASAE